MGVDVGMRVIGYGNESVCVCGCVGVGDHVSVCGYEGVWVTM